MLITSLSSCSSVGRKTSAITLIAALSLAAPLLLASCSAQEADPAKSTTSTSDTNGNKKADVQTAASSLTAENAWAKASPSDMVAGEGMTGVFVTITNSGDKDVKIVGGTSDVAKMVELHEVVDGKMRKKESGFVVPVGGSLELAPGGLHIMLMDMEKPVLAGDDVHVTLEMSDGSTMEIHALVKDTSGANETYDGGSEDAGDSGKQSSMSDQHSEVSTEHDSHS